LKKGPTLFGRVWRWGWLWDPNDLQQIQANYWTLPSGAPR
jgi:hypothetical protein